ncbi:uncharacterized protein Dana_GF26980, isoform B [Drosophila ananassae]|uniref:Uncharacterized protein, isoform B n=1 Tax=Drosophila ananassae TaxID=7217 RepID=A0A0P8XYD4_DROAN|nr:uncharacterized protein Dana_GF26980, isoform B [Drosophila ananassae]
MPKSNPHVYGTGILIKPQNAVNGRWTLGQNNAVLIVAPDHVQESFFGQGPGPWRHLYASGEHKQQQQHNQQPHH